MKNKSVANGLIISFVVVVLAVIAETDSYVLADFLYTIGGLGMWVFGIYSIVKLYKLEDVTK